MSCNKITKIKLQTSNNFQIRIFKKSDNLDIHSLSYLNELILQTNKKVRGSDNAD